MRTFAALAALLVAAIVVVGQTLFVVDQTKYGVVTRFGQIQRVITDPGLNVKTPFVDQVTRFDNRLLRIDIPTQSMPDKDSQFLEIDAYVRYRIEDPRKFWVTLTNELTAESRIGQIVISELRRVVAESDRADIIGGAPTTVAETGAVVVVAKKTSQGIDTREALTRRVLQNANEIVTSARNDFGIEIRDVRIKAADFPKTVEQSVFTRMKTEREVQAKRLRAEGEQQSLNITSEVDKQVTIIRATAEREANRLRGEGEAQAISIFAQALNQDPEFYAFQRSLEAYKKSLSKNTTVVLSSESDLFRYLQSPAVPTPEP
ncbi:MAG: protease modulator HflC [Chloroflexi bacterium]|nr:protease modulator HflC [Chloroflexota bacterium]